jgi:hypothetical protein
MKLKATLIAAFALSLVAAPQALAGPHGLAVKAAKAACRAELDKLGREGFRAAYGAQPLRSCVRGHLAEARESVRNAAQECRAERDADPAQFAADYGENHNGRNAFGKCVSRKVRAEMAEEVRETLNAAQECRAERRADPAQFATDYGSARNAFGKCVSQKARADDEEDETPAVAPPPPPAPAP